MNGEPESTSCFTLTEEEEDHGQFTEQQELPSGGFNTLVRARRDGQWWMLKALKPQYRGDAAYTILLQKEFDILSQLQHPHIVSVSSLEEVEGLELTIVMEWIDGLTLKKWLLSHPTAKMRRHVADQLLDALEYVHSKQAVHRDLKPSNIMITRNGAHVKLIDFGLADTDSYAVFKQSCGTEGFMAPEQASGRTPDQRNDIYSLGCVLDAMHLGWRYRRVARACQLSIERRPQSIAAMRSRLTSLLRWQRALLTVVFAAVIGGSGWFIWQKWLHPKPHYAVVTRFEVGHLCYESWGGPVVTVRGVYCKDTCVVVPSNVNYQGVEYEVQEVTIGAFTDCQYMRTAILPASKINVMRDAFSNVPHLQKLILRSTTPPGIGNEFWPCEITDVFTPEQLATVELTVPKHALRAYKSSPWGMFAHIKEGM